MKKTRILSGMTMFIAIVLILTGYSIIFINDYQVDAKEVSSYASLIKTSYTSYSLDMEKISYDIKETEIFNIKYYTELKVNYDANNQELSDIETKIKESEIMSKTLLHECSVREYNDYQIDYNCEMISHNYESIINAYVSLVSKYNKLINDYNNWLGEQKNINSNKLNEYIPKYYNKNIDINNDGEYSGVIK
ncbi:MAG: hypothetical protein IJN90_00900 [Bacilli bacterium]|nr:hypothetical protein [Bacilli bacterium]